MRRFLNILIAITGLAALTGLILLWLKPFLGLYFFDLTLFTIIFAFSLFVFKIYLSRASIVSFFKWSIVLVLALPALITLVGLFNASAFENSWPLLLSIIIFQCLIGFLSLTNVFLKNANLSLLEKISAIYATILSVALMIVILLKISIEEVYLSFFIAVLVMIVLFFSSLFIKRDKV